MLFGSDTASLGFQLEEQHAWWFDEDQVGKAGHVAARIVVVKHQPAVEAGGVGQKLL